MNPSSAEDLLALASDFAGSELTTAGDPQGMRDAVVAAIAARVSSWLRSDRQRLANALYRIDVAERLVDAAIAEGPIEAAPARIAELIVARLENKLANRARLEAMFRGES